MLQLNDLLTGSGVDLNNTLVMRHTPTEKALRVALGSWAAERPEMFNSYQSSHLPRQEEMMKRAKRLVSFVGQKPGEALFVGVYNVNTYKPITDAEYWAMPEHEEMRQLGSTIRSSTLWFDLAMTSALQQWSGKLIVEWPTPDRAWVRWATKNIFPVRAILSESALVAPVPAWRNIVLDRLGLQTLSQTWVAALSQWRGVYLIRDTSDGKCYVGAAYGEENLYGRWKYYATGGHGGNKKLKERDPANFLFSILERVGPDEPIEEVVERETSWKLRLDTRNTGLNVN